MTRPTRRLAALGLAAALALAAFPRPAAASDGSGGSSGSAGPGRATSAVGPDYLAGRPPCFGPSCVGQSPYISNREGRTCVDGATSLATVDNYGGDTVTLRWSSFCHANWAQWNGTDIGYADYWVETSDGHREPPRGYYTYMVNGNEIARAAIVAPTFSGWSCSQSIVVCTNWY